MVLLSGRLALGMSCAVALLWPFAGSVRAQADAESPRESAIQLDQSVQALKDEAVQFNRDAQIAEDEFLFPPQTRVSVYVSNSVPSLLLREVQVRIDGGAPTVYRYDQYDSRALLTPGALQRVVRVNVPRGAHRITASFSGRMASDEDGPDTVTGNLEAVFDKSLDPADLELAIRSQRSKRAVGGIRSTRVKGFGPRMELKEWRPAQ